MNTNSQVKFRNLEEDGIVDILRSNNATKKPKLVNRIKDNIDRITFDENPTNYIIKYSLAPKGTLSVASSKMYKRAGIQTPQVHLIKKLKEDVIVTVQEDVNKINGFYTNLPSDDIEFKKISKRFISKYKWQLFYDWSLENSFLQFMTPECLEQLQNLFLADELRTDIDRHTQNYFFYKSKDGDKYEGVIAVDLDEMIIYSYCGVGRDDFEIFTNYNYMSATPQMKEDKVCYRQRVRDIKELIYDGVLSSGNIDMLKSLLQTDFPKEIKQACKQQGISRKERKMVVDPINRLWEYNNKNIGRELGL